MLKKVKLCLVLLLFVLSFTVIGIKVNAESISINKPVSQNIAPKLSNDAFVLTDYDGNEVKHVVVGPNKGANRTYTIANVHNEDISSWDVISPSKNGYDKCLAWLTIDLGDEYTIDKITYTMNHDWKGLDVVIQASDSLDFSNAITIYNNDIDNSLGCGSVFSSDLSIPVTPQLNNYGDLGTNDQGNGNTFSFTPIIARYVRVTNNQYGDSSVKNFSAFGEVGIFVFSNDVPESVEDVVPVAFSKTAGIYTNDIAIELSSIYDDAEIFYTLDGSIPNRDSLKYDTSIMLTMNSKAVIRASVLVNGVLSIPSTANFTIQDEILGKNVALNKPIKVKSLDMSQDWTSNLTSVNKSGEEGANDASRINDGSFDMWYAISTENNAGPGWAIIDLEEEFYIDYVVYEAYWDWWMENNIIEIAKTPDFSDAVRIYDQKNGVQTGIASNCNGLVIDANVEGRYIRVTNSKEGNKNLSSWTEIQVIAGAKLTEGAFVSENVALNKPVYVKSFDMSEDLTDFITDINQNQTSDDAEKYINDGQFDFWHAISTKEKGQAWFVIDLGENYWIDSIMYDAYWDWNVSNHQIQIAKNSDFSDATIVFDHDGALKTALGKNIKFTAVEGRYIRVTNSITDKNLTFTTLTELQAFSCEKPTIAFESYLESYEKLETVIVEAGTPLSEIILPSQLTVTDSNGSIRFINGTSMLPEGFDGKAGTYYTKFIVDNESNLNDIYGLLENVEVMIIVEKASPILSVEIPSRIVFDGNAPSISVESNCEYIVEYYQGTTKLNGYPDKAGSYKVVVTIQETSEYKSASVEKTFVVVDYRELNKKIDEFSSYDQNDYTNASWTIFIEQIEIAQNVLNDEKATQIEIDNALKKLSSSMIVLVRKADFSMLQYTVNKANELNLDLYQENGKAEFIEALSAAREVLANDEASQTIIDKAEKELKNAQNALVKKNNEEENNPSPQEPPIDNNSSSKGCGGSISFGMISILSLMIVCIFIYRRKKYNI